MTNQELKIKLIDALAENNTYFRKTTSDWYRLRCPFCGDSQRDLNTGHLYMCINPNDNYRVGYNCFKCEEHGSLRPDQLELFGVEDPQIKEGIAILNKSSDKCDRKNLSMNEQIKTFDYIIPDKICHLDIPKIKYIEDRLGIEMTPERIKETKLVTSLRSFLIANGIKQITCQPSEANKLEDHYVGFLSHGNSHILFRDVSEREERKWIKYPITPESMENRLFYSMDAAIDTYTTEPLTINLAEGVLDIVSAAYNLGYQGENIMNLCVTGKYYNTLLLYLVDLGLVGSNITVNIFSDNDALYNKKGHVTGTLFETYQKTLGRFKYLFKEINIYYNKLSKDIGVTRDNICLERRKL